MTPVRVALVCEDDSLRMRAARAFDHAPAEWEVSFYRQPPESADVVVAVGIDLPGAIPLDVGGSDDIVAEVSDRLDRRDRKVVTVVGASGGCGATSVALHLAAASTGDCLLVCRNRSLLSSRLGLEASLVGADPMSVAGGFKVGVLEAVPPDLVARFEAVIADQPTVPAPSVLPGSTACVLVLTPTIPSAHRAREILAEFPDESWAVVSNRLGPGGETSRSDLQRILGRRVSVELPVSRRLRDAEDESRLSSGWSLWSYRIECLARALGLR
jgi:hypothetical protein